MGERHFESCLHVSQNHILIEVTWTDLLDTYSGDSCHPMLPYLAQGANSSLEDGAVLGLLLGNMTDKAQLPSILRLYESLRKSRGEAIVRETFKQVSVFDLDWAKLFKRTNPRIRDTISTWKMARSRGSVMRCLPRNLARRSRVLSQADGTFPLPFRTRNISNAFPIGHVQRSSPGCTGMMPSRKLRRPWQRTLICSHNKRLRDPFARFCNFGFIQKRFFA